MYTVFIIIHVMIAVSLIGVVLLQRSEGGGLGIGGGGMSGLMSSRGSANLLTRVTAGLAALFMATSLVLVLLSGGPSRPRSILDQPQPAPASTPAAPPATNQAPPSAPAAPAPETGGAPKVPTVPQGQ